MSTQPETLAQLTESIREIRETLQENGKWRVEADRRIVEWQEESAKRQAEADERFNQKMGKLTSRIGEIVENMVGGNIVSQFQNYEYNVTELSRDIKFGIRGTTSEGQIDVLLDDGDVAILIEVKTRPSIDDVRSHINHLEKYRKWKDGKGEGKKRYIGAIAGAVVDDNVVKFAQKHGMFVIVQSGYAVEIVPTPEGFKAKEW